MAMILPMQQLQIDLKRALAQAKYAKYFEFVCQEMRNSRNLTVNALIDGLDVITTEKIKKEWEYNDHKDKQIFIVGDLSSTSNEAIIDPEAVLELVREAQSIYRMTESLLEIMKQKKLDQ